MMTALTKIDDARSFAGLRAEWDDLVASSASDSLFLTWEWLHTWWTHLAGDRRLSILALRSGGELWGLAPWTRCSASLSRGRPLGALEFLGTGTVGSDYLDLIIRRGREPEVQQALALFLAGERLPIDWRQLNKDGCLASGLAALLGESGWLVTESKMNICPFISLAGQTWESYLATLGSEHRYNFHRKWKRLQKDFAVEFEPVRTAEQLRESMDLVVELHNMRWRERGGSEAFQTPAMVSFHQDLSRLALDRGWLRLYILRLNGKPAACLYGFLYHQKFYFYQSGFDPGFARHSVGLLTMGLAIKSAIEEGAQEYDLLHGDEEYKRHWSSQSRELGRLEIYPPHARGWICRSSVVLGQATRRMARRVLPRTVADEISARMARAQEHP